MGSTTPTGLDLRMGYQLKRAATALRGAMDAELRPHSLTVPQYACLELLDLHPDLSNAGLARGAFVTRQAMNTVLRGLEDAGLVQRPPEAPYGRAIPARLTPAGRKRLRAARTAVARVEARLAGALAPERAAAFLADLVAVSEALGADATH